MATKQSGSGRRSLHSPTGVGMFVNLFTPRQKKDSKTGAPKGDPKYQITIVGNEDTDWSVLEAAAQKAGEEKFGANFMKMVERGKYNWPFRDNADRVDDETDERRVPFDDDGVHVSFSCTDKPGVVDEDAEDIIDKKDVYNGMEARVSCRAYAYDNESKGVAFWLVNVQKTGEGERLSGDLDAKDDFKPVKKAGAKKPATKTAPKRSSRSTDDDDDLL